MRGFIGHYCHIWEFSAVIEVIAVARAQIVVQPSVKTKIRRTSKVFVSNFRSPEIEFRLKRLHTDLSHRDSI